MIAAIGKAMTDKYIALLKQCVQEYEKQAGLSGAIVGNLEGFTRQQLEEVLGGFESLYLYGDHEGFQPDSITPELWIAFAHWEPVYQSGLLAYLTARITLAREAEIQC